MAVAGRLSALLRPGDTLARVSGDEFEILCEDLHAASDVELLAVRIDEAFTAPFTLADAGGAAVEVRISASVGMAFAGRAEDIGNQLVRDADIAMYQAKRKGGGAHQVIDLREAGRTANHLELRHDLRAAFSRDELSLSYQPIVRAVDGRVTGLEALLRWDHPDRGPVPAPTMVAIAEQSSLITAIGAWVLERSCKDRMQWLRQHPDGPLDLAVNVSARQLMGSGFRDTVARILDTTGMDPAALILEVTESIFLDDGPRAMTVLAGVKELGVRLALDDFGTGYSSLSYLRRFPVDIIKIDRGFVDEIGTKPTGGAIIAAITNLAHVLGLVVTAEGVETAQQHDEVVAIGCEFAQGFHYAGPLAVAEVTARLEADPSGRLHLPDDRA